MTGNITQISWSLIEGSISNLQYVCVIRLQVQKVTALFAVAPKPPQTNYLKSPKWSKLIAVGHEWRNLRCEVMMKPAAKASPGKARNATCIPRNPSFVASRPAAVLQPCNNWQRIPSVGSEQAVPLCAQDSFELEAPVRPRNAARAGLEDGSGVEVSICGGMKYHHLTVPTSPNANCMYTCSCLPRVMLHRSMMCWGWAS